jgi:transcriptional regulator with XRE-family HTH domain
MVQQRVTSRPFSEELPRLLKERDETLRSLARAIGGVDHGYLSRMVSGKTAVNPHHAERIALYMGLPFDYFPEVREAAVIAAVRAKPKLRDSVYFEQVRRRRTRR